MAEKKETGISLAERFTNSVVSAYADVAKGVAVNEHQRELIANYFIRIDEMLKNSKQGYRWNQVRMNELALTLAHTAKLGLDMALPNNLSLIPFKVSDTGTIRLVPVIGWQGYAYIAKTYGLVPPKNFIVELVYSNDKFSVIKKDAFHESDSYTFEITNPFDRGEIVGGFACLEYEDKSLNRVMTKSLKELLSYRPARYDENFWKPGTENFKKMLEKALAKQILKKVTLDPQKVSSAQSSFKYMESEELVGASLDAKQDISEKNGVGDFVDVDYEPVENPVEPVEDTTVDENEIVTPEDDVLGMNETLFK